MEFKTCDDITNALVERGRHGMFGYSFVPDEYYDVFSHCQKHDVLVASGEIPLSGYGSHSVFSHSYIIIAKPLLMKEYDKFASDLNRTEVSIMGMIATQKVLTL